MLHNLIQQHPDAFIERMNAKAGEWHHHWSGITWWGGHSTLQGYYPANNYSNDVANQTTARDLEFGSSFY